MRSFTTKEKPRPAPAVGDTRIVEKFAWWPVTVETETSSLITVDWRWLERVTVKQVWKLPMPGVRSDGSPPWTNGWVNVEFLAQQMHMTCTTPVDARTGR